METNNNNQNPNNENNGKQLAGTNSLSSNQIIQESEIEEIKDNNLQDKSNNQTNPSQQTQPQINPQGQQINQQFQSNQPQTRPQSALDNKINFTHPMNNYCSPEKINEINNCPPENLNLFLKKRFDDVNNKLRDILKKHEKYNFYSIYYKIQNIFKSLIGIDPREEFKKKDPSLRLKIKNFDFSEVLNNLNCQLSTDEINLILKSLTQKTDTLYSYEEFLENVYNIQQIEKGQMKVIFKDCSFYFNDYLYSFRHYIQDNIIDYKNSYIRTCGGMTTLTYDIFQKFLDEIKFKIGHEEEKQFLFISLGLENYFYDHIERNINSNYISQQILFEMAELKDKSEEDFLKEGEIKIKEKTKNTDWIKNIPNYTYEMKQKLKENYKSLENTFKGIYSCCLRFEIKDLTLYFSESGEEISPDGYIDINIFKDLMGKIDVSINLQFESLINTFKDDKKKPKNVLKLAEFISIYNIFIEEDIGSSEVKFEEEENIRGTNLAKQEVDYIYKNVHRKFTQDDIDYIEELCECIADIIIKEKHDSVTNYFKKKFQLHGGYLFSDEFRDIFENEFLFKIKSNEDEYKIFLDFVTSDKKRQGSYVIFIKHLIHVITYYSGKDEPAPQNNNNNNINTNNLSQDKKINFEEEENIKGTNAPNLDNIKLNENINEEENNKEDLNKNYIRGINLDSNLTPFNKIMSDFAQYLNNNQIRFSDVFPSINSQVINDEELKSGFKNSGFDITENEFSIIINQFDPINKNKVLLEDLKREIAKYQPKYFNQNYQKMDQDILDTKKFNETYFTSSRGFNKNKLDFLNGMYKIQKFLDKNKITEENFLFGTFSPKNRNTNSQVTKEAWKNAFIPQNKTISHIVPYLTDKELDEIYQEMAIKFPNSTYLLLSNIIEFFKGYMRKNENLINYNDQTPLNDSIKREIKMLFDNFDINKTDVISFYDFYRCLKSVDHKATKEDAQNILSQHTHRDNTNNIDRNTFNEIFYNYIKNLLIIQREEKDFIMNLFHEVDIDKNGYLTKKQIKYLMQNKINCDLTDSELDEILNKVDMLNENEINARDFIYLLDNINDMQNINNDNIINTNSNADENEAIPIMNLNLNLNMHRKMRPKDFISIYSGLPLSFIPSFIREEQQKNNLLPSKCLRPLIRNDIFYEDIYPCEILIYQDTNENSKNGIIQTYKKLKEFNSYINCKIYFDGYATGVSSPDETLFETPNSQFKVVGRLLKIALFNNTYKYFVGNAISIDCIYKKEYQDRWYFESDDSKYNNNIIIRYNGNDYHDISVIFEFVLVIQKKVEQNLYTVETSCGWCEMPMNFLRNSRKEKLKIMGGSPLGPSNISEIDIRKKRIGFIPKLANLFEGIIRSECPIRVKPFDELTNNEKLIINYLPSLIVCHSAAMQMISIYRQELGEYILNHKDYLQKAINDDFDLGNMFCKIADVSDAFRIMNEIWKEVVIDGANSSQKNDEKYLRYNFKLFVEKINSILYAEKFKYNPLDPTELPRGDIKLMQDRDNLLNSALRSGLDKKYNKLDYRMEDYSYKPFTMDEINGQKGNYILEKIDEVISLFSN